MRRILSVVCGHIVVWRGDQFAQFAIPCMAELSRAGNRVEMWYSRQPVVFGMKPEKSSAIVPTIVSSPYGSAELKKNFNLDLSRAFAISLAVHALLLAAFLSTS